MKKIWIAAMLFVFTAAARCAPVNVVIYNYQFGDNDAPVTVDLGDTVIWTNTDTDIHTVTCTDPADSFDSGDLPDAASFSHTFHHAGVFSYFCAHHGFMQSNIIVREPNSTTTDVIIFNFAFMPANVTIKAGETVRWNEKDNFSHTVTSGVSPNADGNFDQPVAYQATFSHTFTQPGTYAYFCRPHAGFMKGTVTVTAAPPSQRGDVNGDGVVDIADVLDGLRVQGGFIPLANGALSRLDVAPTGGDGAFNIQDILRISRFVTGLDTTPL